MFSVALTFARRAAALALLVPAVAVAQPGGQPAGSQPARNRQPAAGTPAAPAGEKAVFKTYEEKLSYVLGVNTARRMRNDNVEPEPQAFSRGFTDEFGGKSLLSDEEMTTVLAEFDRRLKAKAEEARKQFTAEWDASFAADKKPKGEPKATQSGLKYEVFEQADGPKPKATDVVAVHYIGRLPDGTVFDSSVARGEPLIYPANQLIAGWTEGLQLMSVGSKYRLYIPAKLAYGEDGFPPKIGPNQDLVFDMHLLQVAPQDQAPPPGGAPPAETPAPPE